MWNNILKIGRLSSRLRRDERGASAIEYGVLAAGIVALIVGTVFAIGPILEATFQTVLTSLQGAP